MKKAGVENKSLCKACDGVCCKRYAGCIWPDEFANWDELVEGLASGVLAIDQWEGDPRYEETPDYDDRPDDYLSCCRFIRPAHKPGTGTTAWRQPQEVYDHQSYGGECVHFVEGLGCRLAWDARPVQCRMLKPMPKGDGCEIQGEYTKQDAALAWLPYQSQIEKAGQAALEIQSCREPERSDSLS